jgi:prepilin-type N-terminal cleavage/methylation domain-containing protein
MIRPSECFRRSGCAGFTLIELLVSLVIGTLIAGGIMGLISVSLQYSHRIKEKSEIRPILESAAEVILANPDLAEQGSVVLGELPGSPVVGVFVVPVQLPRVQRAGTPAGRLMRIMLVYKKQQLEFSIIIPPPEQQGEVDPNG